MDTTEIDKMISKDWLSIRVVYMAGDTEPPIERGVSYWSAGAYNWREQKAVYGRGPTVEAAITHLKNLILSKREIICWAQKQKNPERVTSTDGSYKPLFTL